MSNLVPSGPILRPSQWLSLIGAHVVCKLQVICPWLKQWAWYCFRRGLLIYFGQYAVEVFWDHFKKRKLGATFFRELTLMQWVQPGMRFEKDTKMRVFLRQCGYHDPSDAGKVGGERKIDTWFYGDIDQMKDDTNEILKRMEAAAMKKAKITRTSQAEEMQAVARVLKNFKEFRAEQILDFFKASELVEMKQGDIIFSPEDNEKYFYSVVKGEIHLVCLDIGNRELEELIKVAGPDECIVSLLSFLHHLAVGPQTYEIPRLRATCGVTGKYYRVPISKLLEYTWSTVEILVEMVSSVLIRLNCFAIGVNDLTGILPRLHKQNYLDPTHTPVELQPGIYTGTPVADLAFKSLSEFFHVSPEDRKVCWVGVLDSRTVLLRRFKKTNYAFFIYKGLVACTVSKMRRSYNAIQFYLMEGQFAGLKEAWLGADMEAQYQVADNTKAFIIAVPDFLLRRYLKIYPKMSIKLITKHLERYSPLMWQICYTLRFANCRANEAIYGKDEQGLDVSSRELETYAYLCISGRLRFIFNSEDFIKKQVNSSGRRYGILEKGEWFGLVSLYTDDARVHNTIICDRYCEYVTLPRYMICALSNAFREVAGYQCDYMARNIHRDHEHTFLDTDKMSDTKFQVDHFGVNTSRTYRFVCVYPTSPDIPAKIYCDELARHHTSCARVVTREDALAEMNVSEFNVDNEYLLAKWLVDKEDLTASVLFVLADIEFNDIWNQTISKLCDMLHILLTFAVSHNPSEGEMVMLMKASKARKELVFLHPVVQVTKPQLGPSKYPHLPVGSVTWLKPRKDWVQRHHHVRMLDSAFKYKKEKNPEDLERYLKGTKDPDRHSDYARVMRWISGQSVGVVLGGGGAKGAAHMGVLQYLRELDVPMDYIAGVSIGSFLGALFAVYENLDVVESKAKELWENLNHPMRYGRDFTYNPISALFRGHSFNWLINYFFGSIQIEDLYVPYFCVSTDLNDNSSRMHMSGDLWFYVRASMTLTFVFPPQINHLDYHLLMDGGYSDLVPAMTMRKLGIKYLVAINIGDERLMKTFNIGYHVSGLRCLLQALMPHLIDPIPNHFDFWDAILFCSARNFIQILKAMDEYCIYIRPNVNAYTGIDFQYYDEIKTLGYLSTKFKFGGLHLKKLPVHVIWYLLRFYTFPYVAQSQAQILQGFTDEDWQFAVSLMQKTQMYSRANTPFLQMNLTPYLTDLMEARSYLETYINDSEEMSDINLHVPVLENFFRDDERLDLMHAIGKMKESRYMEDFESIVKQNRFDQTDLRTKIKIHAASSQTYDLANARQQYRELRGKRGSYRHSLYQQDEFDETELDSVFGRVRETYSIRDLYKVDPSLHHAVESYRHLRERHSLTSLVTENKEEGPGTPSRSRVTFEDERVKRKPGNESVWRSVMRRLSKPFSRFSVTSATRSKSTLSFSDASKPVDKGQRLEDFRKYLTKADRRRGDGEKMTHIVTLRELRRSFRVNTMDPLQLQPPPE